MDTIKQFAKLVNDNEFDKAWNLAFSSKENLWLIVSHNLLTFNGDECEKYRYDD